VWRLIAEGEVDHPVELAGRRGKASRFARYWSMMRARTSVVLPDRCPVRTTFGIARSGWSGGSGSGVVTSSVAGDGSVPERADESVPGR